MIFYFNGLYSTCWVVAYFFQFEPKTLKANKYLVQAQSAYSNFSLGISIPALFGLSSDQKMAVMIISQLCGPFYFGSSHEFEQAPGIDGHGSLACCCPMGHKELDTTEQLNWTDMLSMAT